MSEFMDEYLTKRRLEEGLIPIPESSVTVREVGPDQQPEEQMGQQVEGDVAVMTPEAVREMRDKQAGLEYGDSSDDTVTQSIAKGIVNGTIKAGESAAGLVAEGMNMPIKAFEKITGRDAGFRFKAPKPATFETDTVGDITGAVTQFGLQYYTGGNILKAGKILQSGGKVTSIAREVTKGIYADFTAFKGDEERLSNMLIKANNPVLNNFVTQYLAADKDDSDLEGRLKNVLEGGLVGAGVSAVAASLRGLRGAKRAMQRGDVKAAAEIMEESRATVGQIIDDNPEAFAGAGVEEAAPVVNKAAVLDPTPWTPEEATAAVTRLKQVNANPTAILDAARSEYSNFKADTVHTFQDVQGVASVLADVKVPAFKEWSYTEQLEAAELYGVDIPTIHKYYKEGVVNEHILLGSRMVFDAQTQKITDMIMKNIADEYLAPEIAKWGEFLNMTSSFSNIAGRTLGSHNIKAGLARKNFDQADAFIRERFGGVGGIRKFKEAFIATGGDISKLKGLNKQSAWKIANDSALELWKNGILSGAKTMTVNLVGNPLNLYKEIGQRFFQGAAGGVRGAMNGNKDHIYMGESLAMLAANIDSFTENLLSITSIVKNKAFHKDFQFPKSIGDKAERGYTRKISADNWGIGTSAGALSRYIEKMSGIPGMQTQAVMRKLVDTTGSVINVPGNLLNIMDGAAQNSASRAQRYALAYRKLMSEGTTPADALRRMREVMDDPAFNDSISESVEEFAKRATFQADLGTFGKWAQDGIKKVRPLNVPILEYLVPFTHTPINIFTQGVTEVNPVLGMSQVYKGLKEGGIKADEALGRYTFGMSVTAATVMGVSNGVITGAGPQDPRHLAALKETGWRPYSIRVQDGFDDQGDPHYVYYGYNRLEPAAWLIGSVATMMETMHYTSLVNPNKEKHMSDYAAAYIGALGEATMDKAFFQGIAQFFEFMGDPKKTAQGFLGRYAASAVPAIVRDVNILLQETPYLRKVKSVSDAIDNRLIGGEKKLALARNRWGDPISMDAGWALGARSYFSPIGMSDKYAKPIDKEITRLAINGVEGPDGVTRVYPKALPSMPQMYVEHAGRKIDLDSWQYSRLVEIAGKEIKMDVFGKGEMTMSQALNHLVTRDPLYKELANVPDRQAVLIRDVIKPYDKIAKEQLFTEYPSLQKQLQDAERYDMLTKAGISRPEDEYKLLDGVDANN